MSRQVRCPNCGGGHTLKNPGISMLVCDYCQTSVYWDEDMVAKMGAQSILPESDSRLFMNATGKILGKSYSVIGHVRYEHYQGAWDEWYLEIEGGKAAWVSEDERNLILERRLKPDGPVPPADQLQPGMQLTLSGKTFSVREVGRARCVGGEGQLPFPVLPDEEYPYLDIATVDGREFGTVEYDEEGELHAFLGRPLTHEQVTLDAPRPVVEKDVSDRARDVECPNCGAPLERPAGREVETLVCAFCGAQNDLTGAEARVMGVNPKGEDPRFRLEIGQAGTFDGVRYEVCGRMLYRDEESYESREYLLYHPDRGYLWLAEEDGHWVLSRPTRRAPSPDPLTAGPLLKAKAPIKVGDEEFAFYEAVDVSLVYVDGALPWLASVTQTFRTADLIAPPRIFGIENQGGEVEYFLGTYKTPEEIWKAFGLTPPPPEPAGIHPAQPFSRSSLAGTLLVVGAIFAALNLALLAWSYLEAGEERIFHQKFGSQEYLTETISEPFEVGPGKVMKLGLHAPVDNSWIAMDAALVNLEGQVLAEAWGDVSYYRGVEGGERWHEGSQDSESYFRGPPPGTYRMILKAEGGAGSGGPGPQGLEKMAAGVPLTVRLYQGGVMSRYFLIAAILLGLFPLFEYLRRRLFEARRWGPVEEDDDDDD